MTSEQKWTARGSVLERDRQSVALFHDERRKALARTVVCLNALAGVTDPVAWREAINDLINASCPVLFRMENSGFECGDGEPFHAEHECKCDDHTEYDGLRHALSALARVLGKGEANDAQD